MIPFTDISLSWGHSELGGGVPDRGTHQPAEGRETSCEACQDEHCGSLRRRYSIESLAKAPEIPPGDHLGMAQNSWRLYTLYI